MKPSRRAFTLVELLIVIATVALLMAILLPALKSAKIRARKIMCASNLRQIAVASISYASDSAGRLPLVGGAFYAPDPSVWTNSMWPFWSTAGNMDAVFTQSYGLQPVKQCPLKVWDHAQTVPFGFWLPGFGGPTDFAYVLWEGRGYHRTDDWNEYVGPLKIEGGKRKALASDIMYQCLGDGNSLGHGWFSPHADSEMIGFNGDVTSPPSDENIAFTDGSVLIYAPSDIKYVVYAYVSWFGDGPMTTPE